MSLIVDKVSRHFNEQLPFVVFRKPNTNRLEAYFQNTNDLFTVSEYSEEGFVFASFDISKIYIFPKDDCVYISEIFCPAYVEKEAIKVINPDISLKENHISLVQKGIQAIEKQYFEKIVLSRKEEIEVSNFTIEALYLQIATQYPESYAYCWYHPKVGLWMGAFSEQLVKVKDAFLETASVAGTQKINPEKAVSWSQKEIKEQLYVTDFLVSNLQNELETIVVSEPTNMIAGKLVHLKTVITGTIKETFSLKNIIALLHPTPAVCGLPKKEAMAFILQNEKYDREFYAGFFGELNCNKLTELYVNLRCMKLKFSASSQIQKATLFMGGGITKESEPIKEWEETVQKSQTLKQILSFKESI